MEVNIAVWKLSAQGQDPAVRQALTALTLDEAARQMPGGAYTTFRTFQRSRVLRLSEHFLRLEETARLAGYPLVVDRERIRAALQQAIANFSAEESRVRVTLDLEQEVGALYLLLEPLHVPPPAAYTQGVRVVTVPLQRQNPKAKLTGFIETASRVRQSLPAGVNEAVMIGSDGSLLEGLSSNFFAVVNGVIWTAEQGVLSGITRSLVLEAAQALDFPLRLESLPAKDLPAVAEAFITSASRAVLPVTVIDEQLVGNGQPGPVTLSLLQRYHEMIEQALETI